MSETQKRRLKTTDELSVIVSADEHISESVDDILPHIDDDEYGGIKRVIKQSSEPWRELFSVTPPLPPFSNTDMASNYGGADGIMQQGDSKLETKLMRMDEFDIDHGIINPTMMVALPTVNNSQVACALTSGYNEWVYDEFVSDSDRLEMSIVVPGQDPDMGAAEIEKWADKDGVIGVQIGATGHSIPVSHDWWDPIYSAAADNSLPVLFHSSFPAIGHGFPLQHRWHELFVEDKIVSHPFSHMWNLTKLICEGLPEKYPDLTFVFQEAGVGWIPYWVERLDRYYLGLGQEMPMLTQLPSEYIDDQFYFTTQPVGHGEQSPTYLAKMIELVGPENLMFAADIPHSDFDTPGELFSPIKSHFPPEDVKGMMGETAIDVFDLDR